MARPGAIVRRDPGFDAAVKNLEDNFRGLQDAVSGFIAALRIGGADLPAQRVAPNQFNHRMDVPALGDNGCGVIVVTWLVIPPAEPGGQPTFTLVDLWPRYTDLA